MKRKVGGGKEREREGKGRGSFKLTTLFLFSFPSDTKYSTYDFGVLMGDTLVPAGLSDVLEESFLDSRRFWCVNLSKVKEGKEGRGGRFLILILFFVFCSYNFVIQHENSETDYSVALFPIVRLVW